MLRTEPDLSPRRRRLYLTLTCAWFAGALLLLGELFLQIRWTPPSALTTSSFGDHPVYGFAPLPGARGVQATAEYTRQFEHNLLGFRGPLPDLAPEAEGPRLLVLGDSQTYGLGCSNGETFSDHLSRTLEGVDVLNAACNGYGTREPLAIVHHLGERWRPDVILLVFFWNDLEDNTKSTEPDFGLDEHGHVVRLDPVPADFDPLALSPAVTSRPNGVSGLRLPRFLKEGLRGLRYRVLGIRRRSIRTVEAKEGAWEVTAELLGHLAARSSEIGARLVVASLPDHNQVDPSAVIKNIEPLNYEIQDRLFQVCGELGVPVIDLLPALADRFTQSGQSLYYYADRHLVPEGHRVVAERLAEDLRPLLVAGD